MTSDWWLFWLMRIVIRVCEFELERDTYKFSTAHASGAIQHRYRSSEVRILSANVQGLLHSPTHSRKQPVKDLPNKGCKRAWDDESRSAS